MAGKPIQQSLFDDHSSTYAWKGARVHDRPVVAYWTVGMTSCVGAVLERVDGRWTERVLIRQSTIDLALEAAEYLARRDLGGLVGRL